MQTLFGDLRTVLRLALVPGRGGSLAERLESFYAGQADDYDAFRRRLLHGREELFAKLPMPPGGCWVDLGGGTASNLEFLGRRLSQLSQVWVVDLSPSLLRRAEQRIRSQGWTNVACREADATTFNPPAGPVDVVSCSYSLTMIPDWFAAIDRAWEMLRVGGTVGVVDFFVSRKFPPAGQAHHGWFTRTFWPAWFARDNVHLTPDIPAYLHRRFKPRFYQEGLGSVPYLPGARVPYFLYVGEKT